MSRLDRIQNGMDKAQVLDITGFSPRYSDRKAGQDRWVFEVFTDRDESNVAQKEVRFQDGKVVYVGAIQKPSVTAEEQDRLNATAKNDNVSIDDSLKRERKQSVDLKEELSKDMPAKPKFEEIPEDKSSQ